MQTLMVGMVALVSVTGTVGDDNRRVDGTLNGTKLALTMARGVHCDGELLKMTKDGGLGSVVCDDGRKGSFNWTIVQPSWATADGWLDGEPLELDFRVIPERVENHTQF